MTGLAQLGVTSLVSYLVALLLPALDVLIPVLPSETAVIALGVSTAGSAGLRIAVLVALAAAAAVPVTCGLAGYPWRRFAAADGAAAIAWALYAFFIGRLGGKAFEDRPWAGLLVALGLTVVIHVHI